MNEAKVSRKPAGLLGTLRNTLADARNFFHEELWDLDLKTLPRMKKFGVSLVRVFGIVIKGFATDKCTLQASALTYFTLMSLVPVLALTFSVSKGFGAQNRLMAIIGLERAAETGEYIVVAGSKLAELPEQAALVATVLFKAVDNTNFGALGTIGVGLLFWTVIKVMGKIENSFNVIWGVHEARSLIRKFSDYISVLIMVPIMMLMATSANALLSSERVTTTLQGKLGPFFWIYEKGLGFTGVFMLVVAFSCLYMFMPNTRIRVFPAFLGAMVGGGLWYLSQWGYFALQVGLAKNNAIYGTFAAFPFFLFWVYLSWVIVLFGAEVAFAVQNFETYMLEQGAAKATFATRQVLGMLLVHEVARDFYRGDRRWSLGTFCKDHNIPIRLASSVLGELTDADILLHTGERELHYVPAKDLGQLTLGDVEEALRGDPDRNVRAVASHESKFLQDALAAHMQMFTDALGNTSFREMIEKELKA
jgi:membrane protein